MTDLDLTDPTVLLRDDVLDDPKPLYANSGERPRCGSFRARTPTWCRTRSWCVTQCAAPRTSRPTWSACCTTTAPVTPSVRDVAVP